MGFTLSTPCLGVIFPDLIGSAVLYALVILLPVCALGLLIQFLLSLPLRRRERARFFLDLLEVALARGDSPERTLVEMAAANDRTPGVRFHLVASCLEQGDRLDEALRKVPTLLPPAMTALLQAGQRLGNLRGVLPACRELVQDAQSSVRSAESYAVVLLLTFSPFAIWMTWLLFTFVTPKLQQILVDFDDTGPLNVPLLWNHPGWVLGPQAVIFLGLLFACFLHLAGPRAGRWFNFGSLALADRIAWQIPWKRLRLQRIFSRMFAAFLDAKMAEAPALRLAADCTANRVLRRRADKAARALEAGNPLPKAIQLLGTGDEFLWRLRNAMHSGSTGVLASLRGWHEVLDARAFRAEQTAAHIVTTLLVIANGCLVAMLAVATFGSLIAILNAGALW